MASNIIIRIAEKEDLTSILQLYGQLEVDNGDILPLDEAENLFDKINQYPNYKMYVACQDRSIIGTFALLIMDNLAHRGAKSGIVEDVVVSPEWQGKGVGRQMMELAMAECRKNGCYKLVLSSNKKREDAHRFYESLGFEKHGYSFMVEFGDR